jgi:hypothetical protein
VPHPECRGAAGGSRFLSIRLRLEERPIPTRPSRESGDRIPVVEGYGCPQIVTVLAERVVEVDTILLVEVRERHEFVN